MHYCGLGEQTLEEPVRMEEFDTVYVVSGTDTIVEPAKAEGAHVDGGGCRTKDDDEAEEIFDVPTRWHGEVFWIHAVPRDRDLGNVIQQVLYEDL
jgi:hypothetical protein